MRILSLACFVSFLSVSVHAQPQEAYFLSNPTLTPDGATVVFAYEGDLWKSDVSTGEATRLTAMPGYETNPRVSPDGKWIAFTGRQYGNADIFLMPLNGGDIRQLTFHSGNDDLNSWSWDSKSLYFVSGRMGQIAGYKIGLEGGNPLRVFGSYFFQFDHNLVENPVNGEIFFNDTWESANQLARKRYKGPFNPDIQSYNPSTKRYTRYTTWEGKDFGAVVDKKGNVYFLSDEANGEYNLYTFNNGKKTALTSFPTSLKAPAVNANGGRIVFEKGYQLWLYDIVSRKTTKLDIRILRNNTLPKERDFDVRGKITEFDVSPDGKKMAFISRGELFVSDVDGKFIRQISKTPGERAREVKWMGDNRTLLFSQTIDGYLNWFTVGADGNTGLRQLTRDMQDNRSISFNKNKTKAVYLSGRNEVRLLDLKTLKDELIAKDEIWALTSTPPSFSPGDQYISYAAMRGFEQDIFLYDLRAKKVINLTNTGVTETDPIWSSDGKYMYLTSSRLKPSYPFGLQDSRIYQLSLENLDDPFRSDKYDELFAEEKKDTSKKKMINVDSSIVKLDTKRIMERLVQVSPAFGSQGLVGVFKKGEKTTVFYVSDHQDGKDALWKTVIEPFEESKTEKIAGTEGSSDFSLVAVADKLYLLSKGTVSKFSLETSKIDPVNIGFTFRRNLQQEFKQIFEEAWAKIEANYYDEKFHGLDWKKTKTKYEQFIGLVNNRNDMRILINDMLGELNSSHQGFSTSGDDETVPLSNRTMETGIIFNNEDPYLVASVLPRSPADHSNLDIRPGDRLIAVNEQQLDPKIDRNFYLSEPSLDKEVSLTFRRDSKEYTVKIHPQANLFNNLYDQWIDRNQARVDERSKKRIAYAYMKDMGKPELEKFVIDMTQELNTKDALILDIRYNTGGNVHDEVLKFLQQRSYLKWKYREGALTQQGNFTPADKPIVLLINEQSLSDAEMTAQGFKQLGLGKIIGNETYHWIIFTSGAQLVDGSTVRLPSWGCYTLDGKDLELTGVSPDIKVINTFEDKLNGRDPQLDRAIDEIMKQLK